MVKKMHNKCTNKTEINCDTKQCFYEDYWKFMTRVHHDMTHNAWAMSIGELRIIKDEIKLLYNRAVDLTNDNEAMDDEDALKYRKWIADVQYILCNLDYRITQWFDVITKVHNMIDEFVEQNECPFLESLTGKKSHGSNEQKF